MAAVSARMMRGPSEMGTAEASARMRSRSASAKPPSGPMSTETGPRGTACRAAIGSATAADSSQKISGRPAGQASSTLFSGRNASMAEMRKMPHCSAASMALARMRSRFTRSAMVCRVSTGDNRATPISTAFCTM